VQYNIVCHRNMDAEEGVHSATTIISNVDIDTDNKVCWAKHQSEQEVLATVDENKILLNTIVTKIYVESLKVSPIPCT